jgi:ferredoxin
VIKFSRILQIIFFILFVVAFSQILGGSLAAIVLALSPSLHIGNVVHLVKGTVSVVSVLPSLVLILLGLWKGRFFCFNCCPMGFLQDIFPKNKRTSEWWGKGKKFNVFIFVFLFVVSLFSINFLGLFDPLVIFDRLISFFKKSVYPTALIFLVIPVGILAINFFFYRFWCFFLCPLGTFFDLCTKIRLGVKRGPDANKTEVSATKRGFLKVLLGGISLGTLFYWRGAIVKADERLIRTPGALSEEEFKKACVRCGNCMKVCITKGLQPALLESGVDGIFTPRLVPRIGECDEVCRRCGHSCPTGALKPLTPAQKKEARLGIARVDKDACLGWSKDSLCFICAEFCPYLAIERYMRNNTIPCPIVKEDICRGCGLCEKQCPTQAIKVHRRTTKK